MYLLAVACTAIAVCVCPSHSWPASSCLHRSLCCAGVSVCVAYSKPIWEAVITHSEGESAGVSRSGFYKCLLHVRSSTNVHFLRAKPE